MVDTPSSRNRRPRRCRRRRRNNSVLNAVFLVLLLTQSFRRDGGSSNGPLLVARFLADGFSAVPGRYYHGYRGFGFSGIGRSSTRRTTAGETTTTTSSGSRLYSAPPKETTNETTVTTTTTTTTAATRRSRSVKDSMIRMLEENAPATKDNVVATAAAPTPSPAMTSSIDSKDAILGGVVGQEEANNAKEDDDDDEGSDDSMSKFVATSREDILTDPALQMVSSEIGIRQLNGVEASDAAVAAAIILERALDTVEDVLVHLRRVPFDRGWLEFPDNVPLRHRRVVVLGSGWAAHALMKVADCFKIRLTVISPVNHFVFTPMLASASVGTVEYRSMTEAVRDANPMMDNYVQGTATDVDIRNKTVTVQLNSLLDDTEGPCVPAAIQIPYDHLIVAVGNRVDCASVPGAADRCLRLKSCDDARRLRTAVGEAFEYASRPDVEESERSRRVTFVIVGGGPTGVELAGELSDYCQDITKERVGAYPKLRGAVKVVLVHGGDAVLQQFEPDLRHEALRTLLSRGVEVHLNTRVTQVGRGYVKLATKVFDDATGEFTGRRTESTIAAGLSVWCAGIAPVPFVHKLLQKLPESAAGFGGRVNVDRWLRAPMPEPDLLGSVFVLGDAAATRAGRHKEPTFLPQTAQVAGQQGAYVARLLVRGYNLSADVPVVPNNNSSSSGSSSMTMIDPVMEGWLDARNLRSAPGFSFLNLGLLAYTGGGKALSQVQIGDVPVFQYAGSTAFVLWRSVYLVKQVATRNRVLVTFDWIKSWLFGRDTTRL